MWNARKVASQKNGQAKPNANPRRLSRRPSRNNQPSRERELERRGARSRRGEEEEETAREGDEGRRTRTGGGGEPTATGVWRHHGCRPLDGWCRMSLETTRRSAAPRRPYGEREISCICARTSRDLSRCARREGSRRGSVTCCLLAEKPRTCLG